MSDFKRQVAMVQIGNAPADPEPRMVVAAADYDAVVGERNTLQKMLRQAQDLATSRAAENAALRADSARYQWLRDFCAADEAFRWSSSPANAKQRDFAVDAARAAAQPPESR